MNEINIENEITDNLELEETKILRFKVRARGDYLDALESVKDFQEYKSIMLFETIKFTKEIGETNSGSSSAEGNIMAEFIIAIPTNPSG